MSFSILNFPTFVKVFIYTYAHSFVKVIITLISIQSIKAAIIVSTFACYCKGRTTKETMKIKVMEYRLSTIIQFNQNLMNNKIVDNVEYLGTQLGIYAQNSQFYLT